MLRTFTTIIICLNTLYGAVLLNENLYERAKRVDLMLSFDSPFNGTIRKSRDSKGNILIYLDDVEVDKPFYQALQNSFVDSISVMKSNHSQALVKIVPNHTKLGLQASKTVDGFGLRLRIYPLPPTPSKNSTSQSASHTPFTTPKSHPGKQENAALNTLEDNEIVPGWRYWMVTAVLSLALLILWWIKKRGIHQGSWLMPNGKSSIGPNIPAEAIIRYQKPLDPHNRLMLLEYGEKQYLMVVGNCNLLLDTFVEGKIEEKEDFAQLFETNRRELDTFLQTNHPDAYEAFKANASKEPVE